MEQKRVLIDTPDTNWIIKRLGDEPDPFSSTDIGMICENEPTQDCGGDYYNDPPQLSTYPTMKYVVIDNSV